MTNPALKARYWSESLSYKIKNKFQAKSDYDLIISYDIFN